jgi:hypothetical protein
MLLVSYCGKTAKAQEGNNPETKPESDISSSTKKVLRKVGRKSMDTTCELTKSKEECEKERIEHQKAAEADRADTERRQAAKAARKKAKNKEKVELKAKHEIEEQECHEVDGKIQCVGKKIKNKVENIVQ